MDWGRLDTYLTIGSLIIVAWFFLKEPGAWINACFGWLWSSSVSSVSVKLETPEVADEADRQTDKRASAAPEEFAPIPVDRTRMGIIYTLLRDGWTTSEMRPWLRGDNNTISAEIAEARKRLGIGDDTRTIRVRDHAGEREIAL